MKTIPSPLPLAGVLFGLVLPCRAQPALTIYNQNFATVRDRLTLDLQSGLNDVRFTDTTAHVEADSVILRDPAGVVALRVIEQNYRADPISEGLLLSLNEGKEIDFLVPGNLGKPDRTVKGKIIRSGYNPGGRPASQPIIESEGSLRFTLPGEPVFPALGDGSILRPTLGWAIQSQADAKVYTASFTPTARPFSSTMVSTSLEMRVQPPDFATVPSSVEAQSQPWPEVGRRVMAAFLVR